MRLAALMLCVVGLSVGVNGQGRPPAEAQWKAGGQVTGQIGWRSLPDGSKVIHRSFTAKNVEIHVGNTIITADSADVADLAESPGQTEIVLTGAVRVKTVLDPTPLP